MTRKTKILGKWTHKLAQYPVQASFAGGVLVGALLWGGGTSVFHRTSVRMALNSDNGKSLYTLGQFYARRIDSMRLTPAEAKLLGEGFQDWAAHKKAKLDFDSNRYRLQTLVDSRQREALQRAQEDGRSYLKDFIKSGGGSLTLSGLAYRVVVPGSAKKPTLKDWVEVSYRGTLTNGKVIDETTGSRLKVKFPLNDVIAGWKEGLQLIGEGGEIELVIPSELAYGDAGSAAEIPGGATLVFRIQLHRVLDESANRVQR